MKTQANKSPYLQLSIVGIAVILFSTAGFAHIAGWIPTSTDDSGGTPALHGLSVAKGKCAECGVIVSMREIEVRNEDTGPCATGEAVACNQDETRVKSTKSHEITVRLANGSSRVINDANSARWRSGERVVVIGGANPSNR